MSLLTVVQQFCERTGIPSPATVYGTTDTQVAQVRALLEEEGNDLAARGGWEILQQQATHTSLAAEDQGAMSTIASNGFRYILNNTIWDRDDRLPILGPMTPQEWQALKAVVVTGPRYQFRIRGGKLLVNPTPVAGHTWAFEYVSENWILGADGVTYKNYFTLDSDEILLPETLVLLGLRWRWKKEKGFDYAEDFRTYEMQVKDAVGRDGGKKVLNMDSNGWRGPKPGIWVPSGDWTVP
jgi:hypothetical protein